MRTIEVPESERRPAWSAQLRENEEIKVRHRRLIEVAGVAAARPMEKIERQKKEGKDVAALDMAELDLNAVEADRVMALQDAVIVATLASWTLEEPLPTIETVGDMDTDIYEALAQVTRDQGAAIATGVDFEPGPGEGPTGPSDGSEKPSAEPVESKLTVVSGSDGASTAIAASWP